MSTYRLNMNAKPFYDAVERVLRQVGLEMEADVVEWLENEGHVVSAGLRNDVNSEVRREMERMAMSVGTAKKYGPWLHQGTKAHWAPIGPLRSWVKLKFGGSRDEVNRIAHAVQATIAKKGTKPAPYLRSVFDIWRPRMIGEITNRLKGQLA